MKNMRWVFFFFFQIVFILTPYFSLASTNTYSTDLENATAQNWSITDASQTGLDLTGDFTIQLWVKLESEPAAGEVYGLIDKYQGTGDNRSYYISYQKSGGGTLQFEVGINSTGLAGGDTYGTLNYTLGTSAAKHLSFNYDASAGTTEIVVNGTSIGTISSLATSIANKAAPFTIGGAAPGVGTPGFDGLIDDVRVWNTLTVSDYTCEILGTETGLVAYWQFENNALDLTSNNNDLTNNNSATFPLTPLFTYCDLGSTDDPNATTTLIAATTQLVEITQTILVLLVFFGCAWIAYKIIC